MIFRLVLSLTCVAVLAFPTRSAQAGTASPGQTRVHEQPVQQPQSSTLPEALATQIAPPGEMSYVRGEPERFARAVYFAHRQGLLPPTLWESWFNRVSEPAPLASWEESLRSTRGLAKRHNTLGFLTMLNYFALKRVL